MVTSPLEVFPILLKNAKFLLLVVPANLRKLYCGHFGIKIIFLTINVFVLRTGENRKKS